MGNEDRRQSQVGNPFREVGDLFTEVGNPFTEAGNPFREAGNPFREVGNPFREVGGHRIRVQQSLKPTVNKHQGIKTLSW